MSVRYSRLPTEDVIEMESGNAGLTFDYSSAFTFNGNTSSNYKSAFTYNTRAGTERNYKSAFTYDSASDSDTKHDQPGRNLNFEIASRNLIDRVCNYLLNVIIFILFICTFPISVWFSVKNVPNYERLVVFRWGRLLQTKGPGMVFVMPFIDRCHKVDVRMKAFTVPPQQVITGDKAIIEVGADVYYRIASPEQSITNVQNLDRSTRVLLQTSLLNQLVQLPLSNIEGHRNGIAESVQDSCNKTANAWGIEICRLDLSQIKVLQKPPTNTPKPTVAMPPGLGGLGGFGAAAQSLNAGNVPDAFQQLAAAFMAAQGFSRPSEDSHNRQPSQATPAAFSFDNSVPESAFSYSSPSAASGAGDAAGASVAAASDAAAAVTIGEILQAAQIVLSERLVRSVDAVYQFQLSGLGGSVYYLDLKHGSGSVGEGVWQGGSSEVDASLMMTVEDMHLMLSGQLKPFQAYMSGRLKVSGDLSAALRLETFVDLVVKQTSRAK